MTTQAEKDAKFIEELGEATLHGGIPTKTAMELYHVAGRLLARVEEMEKPPLLTLRLDDIPEDKREQLKEFLDRAGHGAGVGFPISRTVQTEEQRLRELAALKDENREQREQLEALCEAVYIEDCHISGTHNPTHTPDYVCSRQLGDLAKRVVAVLFGVDWVKDSVEEVNKIPRKINRESWYKYYQEHDMDENVAELEKWEADGYRGGESD